jgi:hypothetical protein
LVEEQRQKIERTEMKLTTAFTLVSCSGYSSTLKMETVCSPETSIDFQRTTLRYIPENSTLRNHSCEDLKSCINIFNLCNSINNNRLNWIRHIKRMEPERLPKQLMDYSYTQRSIGRPNLRSSICPIL